MSREPLAETLSRPVALDYFLLFAGVCLSLVLLELHPLRVAPGDSLRDPGLRDLIVGLSVPLRLTEGVVLLWPFFFLTQRLRGRDEGLTAGEWLWIISWIGVVLLAILGAWERWGKDSMPEFLLNNLAKPYVLWYLIAAPSMGALALLLLLLGMVRRTPLPWTHSFALVLAVWPVLPLAAILAVGKFA
jgi:hypothetical protein